MSLPIRDRTGRPVVAVVAVAVAAVAAGALLAGCGGQGSSPSVPSLGGGNGTTAAVAGARPSASATGSKGSSMSGTAGGSGPARAAALQMAAQCIRQHGVPGYTDPVLTPSGYVFTDLRSFEDASQSTLAAVQQACGTLLARASLYPDQEPPAPPQFVRTGVRSAECLRAHGMTHVTDPTAQSPYTPGHGFGLDASQVPAGGKASPIWQHAAAACRSILDAEIAASTLASLGNDS